MNNHKERSKVIMSIVYPDSTSYNCMEVLAELQALGKCCYICHDRDEVKPHYHVINFFENQVSIDKFRSENSNIQASAVRNTKLAIQYLIHKNDELKTEYDIADIVTNFDVSSYFKEDDEKLVCSVSDFFMTHSVTASYNEFKDNAKALNILVSKFNQFRNIKACVMNESEESEDSIHLRSDNELLRSENALFREYLRERCLDEEFRNWVEYKNYSHSLQQEKNEEWENIDF